MNNSVSSRTSHIIINIRVKQDQYDGIIENITVCDLAGVENEFTCSDEKIIYLKQLVKYLIVLNIV